MMQQEIIVMVKDSITKLREFNIIAKSRLHDFSYRNIDIQEGRRLLEILRGDLFEDESGKSTNYELVYKEEFKELRTELAKTGNLVRLLKEDISLEVYEKKDSEINSRFLMED